MTENTLGVEGASSVTDGSEPIRVSMTLPGSASLGAFQAGAVAALSVALTTLRSQGRSITVDALGGSSAGSIVALLASHCLLTGKDTPAMLRRAWVDDVDVGLLRTGGDAPLGFDDLDEALRSLLQDTERHPVDVHEPLAQPLLLQVGLTSLLGLTTATEGRTAEVSTLTYADWAEFELHPGHGVDALIMPDRASAVDAVLASAAHPGAFAPRLLDRSSRRRAYEAKGITNFPESGLLWYTDGGLVESMPVSRILAAARRQSGDAPGHRVHLVIDPRSSGASGNEEWSDAGDPKSWLDGLRRSLSILPTQALHDDLRHVGHTNRRLAELDDLINDLEQRGVVSGRDELEAVRESVASLAGIDAAHRVEIEMISPLLLADDETGAADLLAGDFIGAFGGFLQKRLRRSDYRLGWECVRAWLPDGLERANTSASLIDTTVDAVDGAEGRPPSTELLDGDGDDHLGTVDRLKMTMLAMAAGRTLVTEAIPTPAVVRRLRRKP